MDSRQRLAALIAAEHPEPYREDLRTITGARTDLEIAGWVDELARRELGCGMGGALFAGKSVGAVFGLMLESGERVALKLFHPMFAREELQAMQRCLEAVVARGFPAPPPRTQLFAADDRITGGFYAFADGEVGDGHDPGVRRELARSLAELAGVLEGVDAHGLPLSGVRGAKLWPEPHRSFDSGDPDPATAWIDEVGRRAQAIVGADQAPLQPAHLDWGVKNVRFRGGRVGAVYDWDSLFAASEAEMVGRASAEFPTHWEVPGRLTPTLEESAAFVEEYQQARGRRFSTDELAVVEAAADYLVAEVARQEHGGDGAQRVDSFISLLRKRIARTRR
jgi:hypothetical protein